MNKEWKLEEITWSDADKIQKEDAIRVGDKIARVVGWCGDLKGAATGRVWGKRFLLDFGYGDMRTLYVAVGLETCFVED